MDVKYISFNLSHEKYATLSLLCKRCRILDWLR